VGPVLRHRRPLGRSRAALAAGRLSVGFLGGSITAPGSGKSWPEPLLGWLGQRSPAVRLTVENEAIGATGSDLAAFRAGPTVLARGCDLVFVEFAVNDASQPVELRNRTREGLLRQLLAAGCDVVLVYTFWQEMHEDMAAGRVPASIAEFEVLAEHYGIGSVWAGLQAWREVHAGLMTWHEWLPDGLHPENRGSLSYGQSVMDFLGAELDASTTAGSPAALPAAMHGGCWGKTRLVPLDSVGFSGPWSLRRWTGCLGMEQALHTTVPSARLKISFNGRGLALGFDFGRLASEVRFRVDGGEWQTTQRDRPAWAGDRGWLRLLMVSESLAPGPHEFELETVAVPVTGNCGTVTSIGLIGVIE
jgi:hypothetical protein